MEIRQIRWQSWVGMGMLLLFMFTIFLPEWSISADQYMDAAVAANRYALKKDSDITSAQSIVQNYQTAGAGRKSFASGYDTDTQENGENISRIRFARWALSLKGAIEINWVQQNEDIKLQDTNVRSLLQLWGWLLCIPYLIGMITFIFVLVKKRTFAGWIFADGLISVLCECMKIFMMPSLLWMQGKSAVASFDLVGEETLNQYGTGEKFLKELLYRCGGSGRVIFLVISVMLIVYGILCLTVWRNRQQKPVTANDYDYVFQQNPEVWNHSQSISRKISIRAVGEIRGIRGEYSGQSIELHSGEEIVFGRDPEYCMLIFQNPKVSRRQCGIRYDAGNGYYQAIDYSSSGTTLSDGTLLTTSEYTTLLPGTVIYIADGTEAFMVV